MSKLGPNPVQIAQQARFIVEVCVMRSSTNEIQVTTFTFMPIFFSPAGSWWPCLAARFPALVTMENSTAFTALVFKRFAVQVEAVC